MCGIAAYIGEQPAMDFLLPALKAIEYRGYDSHGFLVCSPNIMYSELILKSTEPIGNYSNNSHVITLDNMKAKLFTYGIAHTRWATHGKVTRFNTHPIKCGEVSVVHNGTLDNYKSLKEEITSKHLYNFKTDTDTEIIAFYINQALQTMKKTPFDSPGNIEAACCDAIKKIEGKNETPLGAFVASFHDEYLAVYSNELPILSLQEDGATYIASDVDAFRMTHPERKAKALPDGHLFIYGNCATRINNVHNSVPKNARNAMIDVQVPPRPIVSGPTIYPHHMKAEIGQQPNVIDKVYESDFKPLENSSGLGPVFVGCGSSYLAGKLGSMYWERICRESSRAVYASEVNEHTIFETDNIIPISQSGETKDVINAMVFAQSTHPNISKTGIINRQSTALGFLCDKIIDMKAGPEIGVAATKSFIATAYSIFLLANAARHINDSESVHKEFKSALQEVIDNEKNIKSIAKSCVDYEHIIVLGSGLNYPIASEAALKIKEVSYIHAEAMPSNEVKHGPIALVDKKTLFIFLLNSELESNTGSILQNVSQIQSRGGNTLLCGTSSSACSGFLAPKVENVYTQPLINSVIMQLFAYYLADFRGCDIDKPRNLAKSVTV
jgi:glucosamine--fructose-6-phosphate aminotransferase (isomerizing)